MPALADISFINGETKIPEILIGYLNSRRAEEGIELPAVEIEDDEESVYYGQDVGGLPMVPGLRESGELLKLPCVIVTAESFEKLSDRADFRVSVVLRNRSHGAEGEVVSLAQENTLVAKIRYLLSCRAELMAYVAAISPVEQFRFLGYGVTGGSMELDEGMKIRERVTNLHVRFASYEFVVN
jgi:hypothetical protein